MAKKTENKTPAPAPRPASPAEEAPASIATDVRRARADALHRGTAAHEAAFNASTYEGTPPPPALVRASRATAIDAPPPIAPFREGDTAPCENCGEWATFARGLRFAARTTSGLLMVANLSGFVCPKCHHIGWDMDSADLIAQAAAQEGRGFGVRAKIGKLSKTNLGAYIPRDVTEHMHLRPGDSFVFQPISENVMVVQVERATAEGEGGDDHDA